MTVELSSAADPSKAGAFSEVSGDPKLIVSPGAPVAVEAGMFSDPLAKLPPTPAKAGSVDVVVDDGAALTFEIGAEPCDCREV